MKPYPVNFKFRAEFDLMPSWLPQVLQDWLEEGWTCDITVKRVKGCYGPKTVRVSLFSRIILLPASAMPTRSHTF